MFYVVFVSSNEINQVKSNNPDKMDDEPFTSEIQSEINTI